MDERNTITVSAVVVLDAARRILTVRKQGTRCFMQPGGKPEPGEGPRETAIRELGEEIGLRLAPHQLTDLGTFRSAAANEPDTSVVAHVFMAAFDGDSAPCLDHVQAAAEIAELRWIDLSAIQTSPDLAPLLTQEIAPAVRARIAGHCE